MKNSSIINSYRLNPTPTPPASGVIAGRIVPVVTPPNYRRALVVLAALLLPLLAVGVVVYAARTLPAVGQAVQPAPAAVATLGIVERMVEATPIVTERVMEVQAAPIIVTPTPIPAPARVERPAPVQGAPVQVAPRAPAAPQPTPPVLPTVGRPRIQPTAPPPVVGGPVRAAGVTAPAQPTDAGPQQRLLNRPCEYQRQEYPQGTIIQGYYTDANGTPQDAICRADGWKKP